MVPQERSPRGGLPRVVLPGVVPRGGPPGVSGPLGAFFSWRKKKKRRKKNKAGPRVASRQVMHMPLCPIPKAPCLFRALSIHTTVNSCLFCQPSMAPLKAWQTWLTLSPSSATDTSLQLGSTDALCMQYGAHPPISQSPFLLCIG